MMDLLGQKEAVEFLPLPVDDPKVRKPDITRAKKVLGWAPTIPLDIGMKRTFDYFKARIEQGG